MKELTKAQTSNLVEFGSAILEIGGTVETISILLHAIEAIENTTVTESQERTIRVLRQIATVMSDLTLKCREENKTLFELTGCDYENY